MSDTEGRDLIERAKAGAESAWHEIYQRTRHRLFALLVYQVGDREDARDVLQEAFLRAIPGINDYRGGDEGLVSWLAVIAIRCVNDRRRKLFSHLRLEQALETDADGLTGARGGAGSPADPAATRFRREDESLRRALAALSERQRAALLLRELEEMSFAEVAIALGCNEATARVHHARARERMRTLLAGAASAPAGEPAEVGVS